MFELGLGLVFVVVYYAFAIFQADTYIVSRSKLAAFYSFVFFGRGVLDMGRGSNLGKTVLMKN